MSSRQGMVLTTAILLLMAVAISTLALRGYNPWFAVVGGVWWGLVSAGLLFGVLNALVPARIIRWRESAMVGSTGYRRVVGDWFSRWMAITGSRPWESAIARNRVRMLGTCEVAFWLLAGVLLLLLPRDR